MPGQTEAVFIGENANKREVISGPCLSGQGRQGRHHHAAGTIKATIASIAAAMIGMWRIGRMKVIRGMHHHVVVLVTTPLCHHVGVW